MHRVAIGFLLVCCVVTQSEAHQPLDVQVAALTRLIEASPGRRDLLLLRADRYRRQGSWGQALNDIAHANRLGAAPDSTALSLARVFLDRGHPSAAEALLKPFSTCNSPELHIVRTEALKNLGRTRDALHALDRAIELDPDLGPDIHLERAELLLAIDPPERAEALAGIQRALARMGPVPGLSFLGSEIACDLKNYDLALELLDRLTPYFDRQEQLLARRGDILRHAGRTLEAQAAYTDALAALESVPASPAASRLEERKYHGFARQAGSGLATASVQLVRGPYLQRGTPSSIIIRWRTDVSTASRVLYGDAPGNLPHIVNDATLTTEHEILLEGLTPARTYAYAVGTPDTVLAGNTADYTFKTSSSIGSRVPIRAWIIGDSGTADSNAEAVRNAYEAYSAQKPTDLWLMLGDNAYDTGTDAEYQAAVFDMYPEMLRTVALWPTRGNHDAVRAGPANDYYDLFTLPTQAEAGGVPSGTEAYYSFDYGNTHFICLDSEGSDRSPGGAMLTWLASDLAATAQDWVIAFWHHPPYTEGSHISDDPTDSGGRLRDMRENALPILEAGGVDAVFCGHSHSYERSYLIDGHYGVSSTLTPSMILDAGDGRPTGDGFYRKDAGGPHSHEGAVYIVAGSSGQTSGGALNHPVMFTSLNVLGSVVLNIQGNRLEATCLSASGTVDDAFTMIKGAAVGVDPSPARIGPKLSPAVPNPSTGRTGLSFSIPTPGHVRLRILDVAGRQVRLLMDNPLDAGEHEAQWDGRTDSGRLAGPGTYFGVLEFGGEVRTRKLIRP